MPGKTGADLLAFRLAGNAANREKYGGTDYFRNLNAMAGRAGRGVKKPRGGPAARLAARRKVEPPLQRSGLENATMAEVLAELER